MTFKDVLAQVIDWLQQDKRITYRALKRQFDLDDEYLEDLKAEIIQAKQLAVDEEGVVLVWAGASAISEPISPPDQPTQQPPFQEQPSSQVIPRATATSPPDAERRQLTVMFCDLVDSTRLSSQLDPEEYRDVVRAYQRSCSEIVQRYDGYIAQYLGDGFLVYFGYPQSLEDAAQRAVYTSLGILDTMQQLNMRLEQDRGVRLAVRVGIHTGVVVVGEIGEGSRQEQLALGETPNVAGRIQGLAAPNTVAISEATSRLVQGYFDCQDLGAQTLRGVAEPVQVYRVLQESGARGRLDVAVARGLTPLVGRGQEVGILLERWNQVKEGQGQVVLLTGEGGIGKSRLVQVLKDAVASEPYTQWECRSFSSLQNTALYPLMEPLQRAFHWQRDETPEAKLATLEKALRPFRLPVAETVPLFASLFSLPVPEDRYPPLALSPQRHRQKTLETIVALLSEMAEHQPVLFILEDLHWTDPTTLEFLTLLIDQAPTASIYTLLTCRREFQPPWSHRSYLTEVTVHRLSREEIARMAVQIAVGKTLPDEVLQQIVDKTDGVPLFVEELTKAVLESGHLKEVDGHSALTETLPALAIPSTLQDSLMARLDRLVTAKRIAQLGATIGRQFPYALLQAVSQLDTTTLQRELGRLVEADLVYQRGLPPQATYTFKHALVQDAAYASLLKSTRQHYHQRIAQVLEERFPETTVTQPELLAHHLTEAGLTAQSVAYWSKAAQRAVEGAATVEAIRHLDTGLKLLQALPDTPERTQQELGMQITRGRALKMSQGNAAPEVEQTYLRAWQLCQQLGETSQLFGVSQGLWACYLVRADYQRANALVEQYLHLAQGQLHAVHMLWVHDALGIVCFLRGQLRPAQAHLEQTVALDAPHLDSSRVSRFWHLTPRFHSAWELWALGYPEQALQRSDEPFKLAQELLHPFSLVFALNQIARVHQFRQEGQLTRARAEASIRLATEQGFPQQFAGATFLRGWALTQQGQPAQGIAEMRQGLAAYRATGAETQLTYFLALLAEGYGRGGQREDGLTVLAEALVLVDKNDERFYEAELYRLKGELLLQQSLDNRAEAETCFAQAMAIAQHQEAKSLELRAATSLARLREQQGKREEARQVLAEVYNWFTEGFDTADLQNAKALLNALEEERS